MSATLSQVPGLLTLTNLTTTTTAVQAVIRESLRLSPPGWMTSREAAADITLPNGLFLPQGTVCHIDIRGIQRDPDYWQDPEACQPERFLDKVGTCGQL